jgi:hypothetical protein
MTKSPSVTPVSSKDERIEWEEKFEKLGWSWFEPDGMFRVKDFIRSLLVQSRKEAVKETIDCDHRWTIIALPLPPPEVSISGGSHAVAICCKCLEKRFV